MAYQAEAVAQTSRLNCGRITRHGLFGTNTFGRHALHRYSAHRLRHYRRRRSLLVEAKKGKKAKETAANVRIPTVAQIAKSFGMDVSTGRSRHLSSLAGMTTARRRVPPAPRPVGLPVSSKVLLPPPRHPNEWVNQMRQEINPKLVQSTIQKEDKAGRPATGDKQGAKKSSRPTALEAFEKRKKSRQARREREAAKEAAEKAAAKKLELLERPKWPEAEPTRRQKAPKSSLDKAVRQTVLDKAVKQLSASKILKSNRELTESSAEKDATSKVEQLLERPKWPQAEATKPQKAPKSRLDKAVKQLGTSKARKSERELTESSAKKATTSKVEQLFERSKWPQAEPTKPQQAPKSRLDKAVKQPGASKARKSMRELTENPAEKAATSKVEQLLGRPKWPQAEPSIAQQPPKRKRKKRVVKRARKQLLEGSGEGSKGDLELPPKLMAPALLARPIMSTDLADKAAEKKAAKIALASRIMQEPNLSTKPQVNSAASRAPEAPAKQSLAVRPEPGSTAILESEGDKAETADSLASGMQVSTGQAAKQLPLPQEAISKRKQSSRSKPAAKPSAVALQLLSDLTTGLQSQGVAKKPLPSLQRPKPFAQSQSAKAKAGKADAAKAEAARVASAVLQSWPKAAHDSKLVKGSLPADPYQRTQPPSRPAPSSSPAPAELPASISPVARQIFVREQAQQSKQAPAEFKFELPAPRQQQAAAAAEPAKPAELPALARPVAPPVPGADQALPSSQEQSLQGAKTEQAQRAADSLPVPDLLPRPAWRAASKTNAEFKFEQSKSSQELPATPAEVASQKEAQILQQKKYLQAMEKLRNPRASGKAKDAALPEPELKPGPKRPEKTATDTARQKIERLQRIRAKLQDVRAAAAAAKSPLPEQDLKPGPVRPSTSASTTSPAATTSDRTSLKLDQVIAQLQKQELKPEAVPSDSAAIASSRRLQRLDKTIAKLQEMRVAAALEKSSSSQPELEPGPVYNDSLAAANAPPSATEQRIERALAKLQDMKAAVMVTDTAWSRSGLNQSRSGLTQSRSGLDQSRSGLNRFATSEAAQVSSAGAAVNSAGPGYTVADGNFLSQTFREPQATSASHGKVPVQKAKSYAHRQGLAQNARHALQTAQPIQVTVAKTNAGGAIVEGSNIVGYLPLRKMGPATRRKVGNREFKIRTGQVEAGISWIEGAPAEIRRQAIQILQGETLTVKVTEVKTDGPTQVYLKEWTDEEPETGSEATQKPTPVLEHGDLADLAQQALENQEAISVTVDYAQSGGLVVSAPHWKGYLSWSDLSPETTQKVLKCEGELLKTQGWSGVSLDPYQSNILRRQAMSCLLQRTLLACVKKVPNVSERKTIPMKEVTETTPTVFPIQDWTPELVAILQKQLGQTVKGHVEQICGFGCFVKFNVEVNDGSRLPVKGLIHTSELSWAPVQDVFAVVQPGQPIEAVLVGFDANMGKVWLSRKIVYPKSLADTIKGLLAEEPPPPPAPDSRAVRNAPQLSSSSPPTSLPTQVPEAFALATALTALPEVLTVRAGMQKLSNFKSRYVKVFQMDADMAESLLELKVDGKYRAEEVYAAGRKNGAIPLTVQKKRFLQELFVVGDISCEKLLKEVVSIMSGLTVSDPLSSCLGHEA